MPPWRRVTSEMVARRRAALRALRTMECAEVSSVAVVGAGQMGSGIAEVCAQHGMTVTLVDVAVSRARQAVDTIRERWRRSVELGRGDAATLEAAAERLDTAPTWPANVDAVVEAASEDPGLKLRLFAELGATTAPGTLLVSNTSSISITRLAAASGRPELVAGMHFMNPVPRMALVEVVAGAQSSAQTLERVQSWAVRLGKTPVLSQDHPGFIVNRVLIPMLNEACFALEEGVATPADIDRAIHLGLNHPLGPLALADLIGLDTVLSIALVLQADFGDPKYRPAALLRRMVAAGWLGRKSGCGFYVYDAKGARTGVNPRCWSRPE